MKTWFWIIGICMGLAQSAWPEDGYLQIRREYTDAEYKVKFFKGEIYRYERPNKDSSWRVRYGNLKIVLRYIESNPIYEPLGKTEAEAMRAKEEDLKDKLDRLIKKQIISGQTRYLFDLKAIKKPGQAIIFASNQTVSLTFDSKDAGTIKDLDGTFLDEYIRVIVPQTPTAFIEKAEIQNAEPEFGFDTAKYTKLTGQDGKIYLQQEDGKVFLTNEIYMATQEIINQKIVLTSGQILMVDERGLGAIIDSASANPLWMAIQYFLYFILGLVVIVFLFRYLKKKFSSEGFQRFLKGTFSSSRSVKSDKGLTQTGRTATPFPAELAGEFGSRDGNIFEQQMKVLEASLVKEIKNLEKRLVSNKNEELQTENGRLLEQVNLLNQKSSAATQEKDAIKKELAKKETELAQAKRDLDDQKNQLAQYGDAAKAIDELHQYVYQLPKKEAAVQRHVKFFEDLQGIENKIQKLLTRSIQDNVARAEADLLLMMWGRYAREKNKIPVARWELLLRGMLDRGLLTDRELLRRLKGEKNDEHKWRVLTEQLHKDVYQRWLSAILVLMEEVRNLEHFAGGSPSLIIEEARNFDREIQALCNQAEQAFEMTVHYARLFDDYGQYAQYSNIRASDEPLYPFYRKLKLSLQRDCIQQIVSYGLKSPFVNELTTVILAQ